MKYIPKDRAQHALVMLLRAFHADAIVNINSRMLYHSMRVYGRALAATERLFLCFFCNEQTAMGTWEGWSLRYFYRTFDYVAGVITDSEYLARELTSTYRVGQKAQRAAARLPRAGRPRPPRRVRVAGPARADAAGLLGGPLGPAEADPGVPRASPSCCRTSSSGCGESRSWGRRPRCCPAT